MINTIADMTAWTLTPALLPMAAFVGIDVRHTGASKVCATTFRAVNGNHPGTSVWSPPL